MEHWIVHLFNDESENHVMRESLTIQQITIKLTVCNVMEWKVMVKELMLLICLLSHEITRMQRRCRQEPIRSAALRGAITVLMNMPNADPKLGKGDNILIR